MAQIKDFKVQNEKERKYFAQDFSTVNELIKRIRKGLITKSEISIKDLNLTGIIELENEAFLYITLFEAGKKLLRFGSSKRTIEATINNNIKRLTQSKRFSEFSVKDEDKCRILIEFAIDERKVDINYVNESKFDENRFEPGIIGIKLKLYDKIYNYMPTDAISLSQISFKQALNTLLRKTPIAKLTNKVSERIEALKKIEHEMYFFRSRAFVSFKDKCIALYRGNVIFNKFERDTLYFQVIRSATWNLTNMQDDGRFLYYYECSSDSQKDHEHPNNTLDNLYYNDLRHCGGVISFLRAYQLTKDEKFIQGAKKALNWSVSISKEHDTPFGKGYYAYYNQKAKLGGVGVLLVAMMLYRTITKDKSFDEYIKGYARHLISRIYKNGEFLGYYIHPSYNEAKPLIELNDKERKETFSFYYPGEALFGLALFVNNFEGEEDLKQIVKEKSKQALDWLILERPKVYSDLFTLLPSDGWLMQAIEEWFKDKDFQDSKYLNFVINDADEMCKRIYKRNDSPYIDYEGGMYYNYGDHYYPDGARCEGLVAAYYLANNLGLKSYANKYLRACKSAAKCQFHLFNSKESSYSHKNPEKSTGSIRFKATRQWVRVDSIQHVSCFFARLYMAENNLT